MSGLVILKFKEVKEGCVESLRDAASSAGYTVKEIEISETPDPSLGDISSPLPIRIARMEKKQ